MKSDVQRAGPGVAIGVTESMIAGVVHAFYGRIRKNPTFGAIFASVIGNNWDPHLSEMCDFWSSMLLMSGRFHGTPMGAHIHGDDFRPRHFALLLRTFRETVAEHCLREAAWIKEHLDLDRIGSVHGLVTSQHAEEFSIAANESCKYTLHHWLSQIAKKANVAFDDTPTALNLARIEPKIKNCAFLDNTGTLHKGQIVNLSQIDILIRTAIIPERESNYFPRCPSPPREGLIRNRLRANFYAPIAESEFSSAISFIDG